MTAEIINLRQARKTRARSEKSAKADENRVRFGLPKGEKARQKLERERSTAQLDGHKREPEPDR